MVYLRMLVSKRTNNIYTRSNVIVIINLDNKNNNVKSLSRKCNLYWAQLRNILNILSNANIIKINKRKDNIIEFNLTTHGVSIRNYFLRIEYLLKELERQNELNEKKT